MNTGIFLFARNANNMVSEITCYLHIHYRFEVIKEVLRIGSVALRYY